MPELPDVRVYVETVAARVLGHAPMACRIANPFVLRTTDPAPAELVGRRVVGVEHIGKRIVLAFQDDLFLVIHLMIAGRLRWRPPEKPLRGRLVLAELAFGHGSLFLTEAGTKRRAMLHIVRGRDALAQFDRGGLDVMTADTATFAERLRAENHTLRRALTDPRILSGIGNAYSDEILHRARLSPLALTQKLGDEELARLHDATRATLVEWTDRLRAEAGGDIPEKVTAFHPQMAVHGRFGQPCPVCGTKVQRIRYADNETNYCPRCQTGGRLLADRALSRLLREDFPSTAE